MLKFERPQPDTQEITHVVEMETTWNLEIDNGEEITEVEIVLCYERINQGLYFTKVKVEMEEWKSNRSSEPTLRLRVWIHQELEEMFEGENVDSLGIVARQIVDMICAFVNDNDIEGVL